MVVADWPQSTKATMFRPSISACPPRNTPHSSAAWGGEGVEKWYRTNGRCIQSENDGMGLVQKADAKEMAQWTKKPALPDVAFSAFTQHSDFYDTPDAESWTLQGEGETVTMNKISKLELCKRDQAKQDTAVVSLMRPRQSTPLILVESKRRALWSATNQTGTANTAWRGPGWDKLLTFCAVEEDGENQQRWRQCSKLDESATGWLFSNTENLFVQTAMQL